MDVCVYALSLIIDQTPDIDRRVMGYARTGKNREGRRGIWGVEGIKYTSLWRGTGLEANHNIID